MKPLLHRSFSLLAVAGLFVGMPAGLRAADSDVVTLTGEVVDLVCYTDSGASGPGHADCAKVCINAGLPVGLKAKDGKTYLLVGEHKPLNSELAPYAAKTITLRGKLVGRDGISLLENAEIVK